MAVAAAAVQRVPAASLHVSKPAHWLESRFHFSFADWWDPARVQWGVLRVVNDDLVQPHSGFGRHPHRDAEIFSYVLDGQLSHADSMGHKESLSRGAVQYLSAGSGITHSEMNDHDSVCRFLQVWLLPDRRGFKPLYGSKSYSQADRHNRLLHLLSGTGAAPAWPGVHSAGCIGLHTDANVYVSESDAGVSHELQLSARRQAYIVCAEGSMRVNDEVLHARDAARIKGADDNPTRLNLTADGEGGAHWLLIEMAKADD